VRPHLKSDGVPPPLKEMYAMTKTCGCAKKHRLIKTGSGRWIYSGCLRERGPKLREVAVVRQDADTSEEAETNLASIMLEVRADGLDPATVFGAPAEGEALTSTAVFKLREAGL
jgi:hypothetical protein